MLDMIPAGYFASCTWMRIKKKASLFQQWPISQVYFTTTKRINQVDTVFSEYSLSAAPVKSLVKKTYPEDIRKAATDKPDTPFRLSMPLSRGLQRRQQGNAHPPVSSCHVEVKDQERLSVSLVITKCR